MAKGVEFLHAGVVSLIDELLVAQWNVQLEPQIKLIFTTSFVQLVEHLHRTPFNDLRSDFNAGNR